MNPILFFIGRQDATICTGVLQGGFHLIDADTLRIVRDCIGFLKPQLVLLNTAFHLFDTIEPIQGCFADIVSAHVEYDLRIRRGLLVRGNCHRCKQKHQN
ncbi:MAG: hypothetical protein QNJ26_03600 [Desulfobacterales bacterium]|nr:hypothetical protein [Desulfobacterales bacterium]